MFQHPNATRLEVITVDVNENSMGIQIATRQCFGKVHQGPATKWKKQFVLCNVNGHLFNYKFYLLLVKETFQPKLCNLK